MCFLCVFIIDLYYKSEATDTHSPIVLGEVRSSGWTSYFLFYHTTFRGTFFILNNENAGPYGLLEMFNQKWRDHGESEKCLLALGYRQESFSRDFLLRFVVINI